MQFFPYTRFLFLPFFLVRYLSHEKVKNYFSYWSPSACVMGHKTSSRTFKDNKRWLVDNTFIWTYTLFLLSITHNMLPQSSEKNNVTTLIHDRSAHHKLMLNSTILKIFRISTETIFRSQSLFGYLLFANSSFIISSVCAFISHHNKSRRFNGIQSISAIVSFYFYFLNIDIFFRGSQ